MNYDPWTFRMRNRLLYKFKYHRGVSFRNWHGFTQRYYIIKDRLGYVVDPPQPISGNPWVWRTRFPDFHFEMDLVLLQLGFRIAYVDTDRLHGGPRNLELYDAFYDFCVNSLHLSPKTTLEAVSRGGLSAYSWAKRNAGKINCIYADTPVCDIKSWPRGGGKYGGSPPDWALILQEYGMSETQAMQFDDNPIDHLEPLATAGVPIMHLIGKNDKVVIPEENTYVLAQRYQALGGKMTVLVNQFGKEECEGHHFEIDEPWIVVQFILSHTPEYTEVFRPVDYFPNFIATRNNH
jgi:sialidase-1